MEIVRKSPQRRGAGRKTKYRFNDLNPGDCMVIKNQSVLDCKRISSALYGHRKRNGLMWWDTTVRQEGNEVHVYRIS